MLIAPPGHLAADSVRSALSGGDVASLILPQYGGSDADFQSSAEALTPIAQEAGVAVILAGDPRIAMRVKADGVHFEGPKAELAAMVERHGGRIIVGTGGVKTRDEALELGEAQPDYMFFGRFGYDRRPEPHPRNIGLASWWAEMVEIPCIVLGGNAVGSVADVARTGAEFVALSEAVWSHPQGARQAVHEANVLLDEAEPSLEAGAVDAP